MVEKGIEGEQRAEAMRRSNSAREEARAVSESNAGC
jgi:hypothetical protein